MPPMVIMGVMAAATIASTIAASNAQRAQGQAQQSAANYAAAQLNQNAGQAQASGQHAMVDQDKQNAYVLSNEKAAASGQGGTTTDPGVMTNSAQIATEGGYRAATALYQGDAKAQSLRAQASGQTYQGTLDAQTANTNANTTLINGASSLFQKYGSFASGGGGAASPQPYDPGPIMWNTG